MTSKRRLRPRRSDERQIALPLPSAERYKLFFAVLPPASLSAHLVDLAQRLGAEYGVEVTPRIPQVTVYSLGDYDGIPHQIIAAVSRVAQTVRARSFDAVFDSVQVFKGPRQPLLLRCGKGQHGFVALQNAIGNALAGAGEDRPQFDSSFTPHLALFDRAGAIPEQRLDAPLAWHVENFALILGLPGHKHYEPYGEWPLQN